MAKIDYVDGRKVRGKLCKKSKEVHRVRNGREQVYEMEIDPGKPSKSQKAHRSLFGATNAIVNRIMLDPEQVAIWEERMKEYPAEWINGYDPSFTIRQDRLYAVRAVPSLYLLDARKTVVLKDAPAERVLELLSSL